MSVSKHVAKDNTFKGSKEDLIELCGDKVWNLRKIHSGCATSLLPSVKRTNSIPVLAIFSHPTFVQNRMDSPGPVFRSMPALRLYPCIGACKPRHADIPNITIWLPMLI